MTPQDAVNYVDSILGEVPATRAQHVRIQQAMDVIARAVQRATLPPALNSPEASATTPQSQLKETPAESVTPRDS